MNTIVVRLLDSPLHRLMSGSTDVIRYAGRRSGKTFTLPTQYATRGEDVIILVGRPDSKSWWRNFSEDRDIEVLIKRRWLEMVGRAVVGSVDPEVAEPLLDAYLAKFPRAARVLGPDDGHRVERAVLVWCRPRAR